VLRADVRGLPGGESRGQHQTTARLSTGRHDHEHQGQAQLLERRRRHGARHRRHRRGRCGLRRWRRQELGRLATDQGRPGQDRRPRRRDRDRQEGVKASSIGQSDLNKKARSAFTAGPNAYTDNLNFHDISSGDPDTTIFQFTVPAGNYLVSASANVTNTGAGLNDFTCAITQPVGEFTRTIATSEVRVQNGGGDLGTISLDGAAVNTKEAIELTMSCQGQVAPWSGKVVDPSIVAVKVGALTEK
jgi:hypothetical protein